MCVCVCVRAWALACILICSVVSDSFATLWTIACPASLSMGLSRQQYWSGSPFQGLCSFCLAYLGKLILATQVPHFCPYFGNCFSSARIWLACKCSQRPFLMTVTLLSLGWAEWPSFVVGDSWLSFHPALTLHWTYSSNVCLHWQMMNPALLTTVCLVPNTAQVRWGVCWTNV